MSCAPLSPDILKKWQTLATESLRAYPDSLTSKAWFLPLVLGIVLSVSYWLMFWYVYKPESIEEEEKRRLAWVEWIMGYIGLLFVSVILFYVLLMHKRGNDPKYVEYFPGGEYWAPGWMWGVGSGVMVSALLVLFVLFMKWSGRETPTTWISLLGVMGLLLSIMIYLYFDLYIHTKLTGNPVMAKEKECAFAQIQKHAEELRAQAEATLKQGVELTAASRSLEQAKALPSQRSREAALASTLNKNDAASRFVTEASRKSSEPPKSTPATNNSTLADLAKLLGGLSRQTQ